MFAICISSLIKWLYMSFTHFPFGFFVVVSLFLLLSFKGPLYSLDIEYSSVIKFAIFLPIFSLTFHPLNQGFCKSNIFNLMKSNWVYFYGFSFLCNIWELFLTLGPKDFFLCVLLKVYSFTFTCKSVIHFDLYLV